MPVRLIAIDIDGTLLDSHGEIPHDNRVAIAAALARGIEVALVTGRAFHFARPIATRLGLPVLFMVSNGALIKTMDGERLLARLMPAPVARGLLERTRDYRADAAVIFDRPAERQVVAGGMDWQHPSRVGYWARNMDIIDEVVPLEACLVEDPIQVMFNGGVERMRTLAAALDGAGEADEYSLTITEYAERDFTLVDVLAAGVSKGTTVGTWARERGYTRDEVMAIGDNYNDVAMLEYAGVPVVMGNAVPELLESGYPVTASNDEAGLARAIERYALSPLSPASSPEPGRPPTP
jgi:Cof subfamily protein (haloacid dehalogenase superfamily)